VRELANLIERLSIVWRRVVEVRDLPPKYRPPVDWTLEVKALEFHRPPLRTRSPHEEQPCWFSRKWSWSAPSARKNFQQERWRKLTRDSARRRPRPAEHLLTIERQLIEQALQRSRGTVAKAARS